MANGLLAGITAPISMLNTGESDVSGGMVANAPAEATVGGEKPKKPKPQPKQAVKQKVKPKEWDAAGELLQFGGKPMKNQKNSMASLSKQVGGAMGVDPSVLLSSAWVEGGNKQSVDPGYVSPEYEQTFRGKPEYDDFPVDGLASYGIDTIGDKWKNIKKYLPPDFENRIRFYDGKNEWKDTVKTAAFDSDQAALMAKAAMLKYEQDRVADYAKEKGIELDDDTRNYFTMIGYNRGNAFGAMDEYAKDADKKTFISGGRVSEKYQPAHKNVSLRMKALENARSLLKDAPDVVED